jgi:hypothetical protein
MDWGQVGRNEYVDDINFDEVFSVLGSRKYNHSESSLMQACFGGWGEVDSVEAALAHMIRLGIFGVVAEFVSRIENGEVTEWDAVMFALLSGAGVKNFSEVVEAVEKGLKVMYNEARSVFEECVAVLVKKVANDFGSKVSNEEVLLQ